MQRVTDPAQFALQIPSIDEQHFTIIRLLNQIADMSKEALGEQDLMDVFSSLQDYAITHFSHEEECMRKAGFPGLSNHKKDHDFFLRNLTLLKLKLRDNAVLPATEMADFLSDWLINHIGKRDREYLPYFEKAGIE
jgi:hemerythrin-like metal-binding protein